MKIKVEVDLSDLYSEEEGENYSQVVKAHITGEVKREVLKHFKETTGDEFSKAAIAQIEVSKHELITKTLEGLAKVPMINVRHSKEPISLEEHIRSEYEKYVAQGSRFDGIIEKAVIKAAQDLGMELKDRYDMLFASQIVMKLNEQGMLREDVAKVLLDKKKD